MGGSTFSNKWGWGTQCTGKQWHTFINNNSGCIFSHQWQYLYLMMVSQLPSFVVGKRFMAPSGSGVQWVSMFVRSFLFLTLKLIETHYQSLFYNHHTSTFNSYTASINKNMYPNVTSHSHVLSYLHEVREGGLWTLLFSLSCWCFHQCLVCFFQWTLSLN